MNARPQLPVMEEALLREGGAPAFFQLMRILRLHYGSEQAFNQHVRVRPNLSFAFPGRDIETVERIAAPSSANTPATDADVDADAATWRITANFFGLYGVSSPLPAFYTEDLFEEQRAGRTASRDFLDIIHAALYPLLQRSWEKYRLWLRIGEHGEAACLDMLLALIGRMDAARDATERAEDASLLPYASLFIQQPRSALGLQALIAGRLDGAPVTVVPCMERHVPIPADARCQLGGARALGDALLGEWQRDRGTAYQLEIGPIDSARYHALLPGGTLHRRLARDVALYRDTPLTCLVRLRLDPDEAGVATVGGAQWGLLGFDTWLGEDHGCSACETRFLLESPGIAFGRPAPQPQQGHALHGPQSAHFISGPPS
jgi:type VI secretion system protein ImpH